MKLKFWNIILILALFSSCKIDRTIDGNYSSCYNGEYSEVYFKQDSMRVASEDEWVKLSEWRKIEIKNDTLYFDSFGEWRDDWKAKIEFNGINKIELHVIQNNAKHDLEPIKKDLNFENLDEFWNGFNKRMKSKNCELINIG
jgi:hypothetical protein